MTSVDDPTGRALQLADQEYVLGTALGWGAFDVERFDGEESIGEPYAFDIVVWRDAGLGRLAVDDLVAQPSTLRIRTAFGWRPVHGVLTAAEELERATTRQIFRLRLEPRWALARYRIRHRTFVDRTVAAVVSSAFEALAPDGHREDGGLWEIGGDPVAPDPDPSFGAFAAPRARYRWAVADRARIDDLDLRRLIVQYGESDLELVARLLEEEGLSMIYEQSETGEVLTVTDSPAHAPLLVGQQSIDWRVVPTHDTQDRREILRNVRRASRVRPHAVTVRDFNFKNTRLRPESSASDNAGAREPDLAAFGYPGRDENAPGAGRRPASNRLERSTAEALLSEGWGNVRTLQAGHRIRVTDVDVTGGDEELLLTRVVTRAVRRLREDSGRDADDDAVESGPIGFAARFEAMPAGIPYRPARRQGPRIWGVQPAKVTAEELGRGSRPEIHCDGHGRVRVRFPWDQREDQDNGIASSDWVRVSQAWAGASFGAVFIPRVGQEVLVAYEQGDPERPIVVGRVYDAENPHPYDLPENKTVSTVKSHSTPQADGFNELRFQDRAGEEQIFLHAQRDLDEVVIASHSTDVGGSQSNSVGGDQSNSVGGNRTHSVQGKEQHVVGGGRYTTIETFENRAVLGPEEVVITGGRTIDVTGSHAATASEAHTFSSPLWRAEGSYAFFDEATEFRVRAAGCELVMRAGVVSLTNGAGSTITLGGGHIFVQAAGMVTTLAPVVTTVGSADVSIASGGNVNVKGAQIKLND